MRVRIDDRQICFREKDLTDYLKARVEEGLGKEIKLPNGPTIDLRKNSLTSVAIRQVFSMFIPFITWLAAQLGMQLPKKEKHGDVIRYTINAYFDILARMAGESILEIDTEYYIDELTIVTSAKLDREVEATDIPIPFLEAFHKK